MRVGARGRYAVMAMVDLAGCSASGGETCRFVTLAEVAGRQQISVAYLEQIFCRLRRAGLVSAVRGPGGGYRLARGPAEIAIIEIIRGVDEPIRATRCRPGSGPCMPTAGERCQTHDLWAALECQIERFLGSVTLADVLGKRLAARRAA